MTDEPDLRLVGLSIWVDGRERPYASDPDDSNWLYVRVRMEAPGAIVECQGAILMNSNFAQFAEELTSISEELEGEATLESIEPGLTLSLKMKALGQLDATVEITPDYLTQAHHFTLTLDQSYLPGLISSCEAILKRHPISGSV